jgi:UDP-N-acetylmuramate dehydrogenase
VNLTQDQLSLLRTTFGSHLQENISLKRFTAARIGGAADAVITAESSSGLAKIVKLCWENEIPFVILGSGSNVLVSDRGVRQLVVLNRAKRVRFSMGETPYVYSESGANFGALARQAATHGLSGLEWAAGIPGTVGGAVYGNAGAHGSDMSSCLLVANILQLKFSQGDHHSDISEQEWSVAQLDYGYRTSSLKRQPGMGVILAATLKLSPSTNEAVQAKMDVFQTKRRSSQPIGASLGSIFKNPPGDHAGRLIEATGLKGAKIGQVEVSQLHANFMINHNDASADDYAALIRFVQEEVYKKYRVHLELEIELIGDWKSQ